ncbi:MAG: lactate racemase domain-containing protein [candidate division KSB1 bacterium]|nr:lactate racemase domain-containing protein [candidate division KSB1 bacterium]
MPWRAWFGDERIKIFFPNHWRVEVLAMNDAPAMPKSRIAAALMRSVDEPPLYRLAVGKRRVAIAVDDLSRPTPAGEILPALLAMLGSCGLRDEQITIIISLGSHTALKPDEIIRKVGAEVASRVCVENHDCHANLVDIGVKVGQTPVLINRTFAEADLKILLGSVVPHVFAGFSGGAKMVLPGLSNIESIEWTHKAVLMGLRGKAGTLEGNRFRAEFERVARHVGVQLSINVVVNSRREIAGLFVGDLEAAHRRAAEFAREVYATRLPAEPLDVAILNAYPKDDELLQAENALMFHHTAPPSYLKEDGLILLTSACSLGMGHHGLFGPAQRLYRKPMRKGFLGNRHLATFMPGVSSEEFHQVYWEGYPHCGTWEATLEFLQQRYSNGARVGIFPCSSIQIAMS